MIMSRVASLPIQLYLVDTFTYAASAIAASMVGLSFITPIIPFPSPLLCYVPLLPFCFDVLDTLSINMS